MQDSLTTFEFLFENFSPSFSSYLRANPSKIIDFLFIFEAAKTYIKLKTFLLSSNDIIFTDNMLNLKDIETIHSPDIHKSIELSEIDLENVSKNKSDPESSVKNIKKNLKFLEKFEKIFTKTRDDFNFKTNPFSSQETLHRTKKQVSLPVPFIVKNSPMILQIKNKRDFGRKPQLLLYMSEVVYIVRPMFYCFFLKFFGVDSWTPFFINLGFDLLWLFLFYLNKFMMKKSHKNIM